MLITNKVIKAMWERKLVVQYVSCAKVALFENIFKLLVEKNDKKYINIVNLYA